MRSAAAAPPPAAVQNLGEGLTYLRVRQLPDDATALAAAWSAPALIVDLRYAAGAATLTADLPARPLAEPLFVLVGPATPRDVLAALRHAAPALLTLGVAAPDLAPDIAISVAAETDRRAYEALDAGTPIEALINVKNTNKRFDEATLNREHEKDRDGSPEPPAPPDAAPGPPAAADAPATPPDTPAPAAMPAPPPEPLIDTVLQRAVQIHRALLVLRKVPTG